MLKRKLVGGKPALLQLLVVMLFASAPAFAGSKFQSAIIPAPAIYDSGSDLQGNCSAGAMSTCAVGSIGNAVCTAIGQGSCVADGVNDSRPIPACLGAPADAFLPICVAGPNKGEVCDPTDGTTCGNAGPVPGTGNILCGLRSDPDGVTIADVPSSGEAINPKSKVQITDTKLKATISFVNVGLNTIPFGTCDGGEFANALSSDGLSCVDNNDCGDKYDRSTNTGGLGTCVNGDEYVLQCDITVGSNLDNTPVCAGANQGAGQCLSGLTLQGADGSGMAPVPGPLLGSTGACSGGIRHGRACQTNSSCPGLCAPPDAPNTTCTNNGDCPMSASCSAPSAGICSCALAGPLSSSASGDEVCIRTTMLDPIPIGDVFLCSLCPFSVQLDFRFEVKAGKGKVKVDLSEHPLFAFIPDGVPIDVIGCYVHENTAPTDRIGSIGVYRNQVGNSLVPSFFKRSCPDVSVPIGASLGLNVDAPTAPIIGVTGVIAEKGPGKFFEP